MHYVHIKCLLRGMVPLYNNYINQLTNGCRVVIGMSIIGAIIGCICCCYCIRRHISSSGTNVQTVRTYNITTANQPNHTVVKMEPYNQPSSSGFTSNTNAPPPYSETN